MRIRGAIALVVGAVLVAVNLLGVVDVVGVRWVAGAAGALLIVAGSAWVRGQRI